MYEGNKKSAIILLTNMIDTEIIDNQPQTLSPTPAQPRDNNFFAMMFLGGFLAWLISFIVRIATGESLFARDLITLFGPVVISVGDILLVSGFIVGAAINILGLSRRWSFVILASALVILLIIFSAVSRQ